MIRSFLIAAFLPGMLCAQTYFQQETDYKIKVRLDDTRHFLSAEESIRYKNNSKETLNEIWFHLWPNAYKNKETAFAKQQLTNGSTKFQYANDTARGYIDSLDFKVNGETVKMEYHVDHIDIARIILNKPLEPGGEIIITTPFKVKIPSSAFSRLGHAGQQYQLCQWYPKPAVYDKAGWHPIPYLSQGEFYSEFGSFEVEITVPENYVVAASGELQSNPEEQARIDKNVEESEALSKSGFSKDKKSTVASSANWKTVTYKLDKVHDFAWFADKSYHILRSSVQLERSGRTVDTYVYFSNKDADMWKSAAHYVDESVKYYSKWVGDYPYNVCKAVDGALSAGAGMEYPTITVVASSGSARALENVIAHEVGHNWFYGILASNERDHPWMDEGTNSYYENRYMTMKFEKHSFMTSSLPDEVSGMFGLSKFQPFQLKNFPSVFSQRRNFDQALNLTAPEFTGINYAFMVYMKTASIYNYLAASMGQEEFDKMMQSWYDQWSFKHPSPADFKAHVEGFNKKEMPWLFDDLLASRKRVDYKICKASGSGNEGYVKVKNVGQIEGPVSVSGINGDDVVLTKWFDGFEGSKKLPFPVGAYNRYSVNGTGDIPDVNAKNDEIRSTGLFKKGRRPKISFLTGLEHPRIAALYVLPAIGYNYYNGFMAGAAIHNIGMFRKKIEFIAVPLYGFENRQLAGSAQLDYFIRPVSGCFRGITLTGSAERYALRFAPGFTRFTGGITFLFDNRREFSKVKSELRIRHVSVITDPYGNLDNIPSPLSRTLDFNQLTYTLQDARVHKPYSIVADVQQGSTFVKGSATINHRFNYNSRRKGLDVRLFAGAFLWKSASYPSGPDVRFRLSGQTGIQDYLYDDIFLGRHENSGLLSQQMTMTDGAFSLYTLLGQSDRFLTSINLRSSIPKVTIICVYVNAAAFSFDQFEASSNITTTQTGTATEAGINLSIIRNVFEIYAPVVYSKNLADAQKFTVYDTFGQRIRFVLNFRLINPLNPLRTLRF